MIIKRKTRTTRFFKSRNRKKQENRQRTPYTKYKATRKLARRLARARMKREGLQKLNHRIKGGDSLFAREWRKYI